MEQVKFKDVAHLYLGCKIISSEGTMTYTLDEVSDRLLMFKDGYGNRMWLSDYKAALRHLSDMTDEEAGYFAWLCMDSQYHLEERVSQHEIQIQLVPFDGGNLLDSNVELYIGVSCRCFEGAIIFRKDGSICIEDENSNQEPPIENITHKILYLLRQGFDLFNLIESKQAIDATTLKNESTTK